MKVFSSVEGQNLIAIVPCDYNYFLVVQAIQYWHAMDCYDKGAIRGWLQGFEIQLLKFEMRGCLRSVKNFPIIESANTTEHLFQNPF